MTEASVPAFSQLNLVVRDLAASLEFYRHLGVPAEAAPGSVHASAELPGGIRLEWDTEEFAAQWDSASRGAIGGTAVLGFSVQSRQAVDDLWAELTAVGYRGHSAAVRCALGSQVRDRR